MIFFHNRAAVPSCECACSSFEMHIFFIYQPVNNADFIIPVEIDGTVHQVWSSTKPPNLLCSYIKRMS